VLLRNSLARNSKVIELRTQGFKAWQIAQQLGVAKTAVRPNAA